MTPAPVTPVTVWEPAPLGPSTLTNATRSSPGCAVVNAGEVTLVDAAAWVVTSTSVASVAAWAGAESLSTTTPTINSNVLITANTRLFNPSTRPFGT